MFHVKHIVEKAQKLLCYGIYYILVSMPLLFAAICAVALFE